MMIETIGTDDHRALGERRVLLLDGARAWTLRTASDLIARLEPARACWISNAAIADAVPPAKVQRLLGGECDLLVVDAWAGLDADALGAAVGTLRGGGLLLVLTPTLEHWPAQVDPEAERLAMHPCTAADVGGRFIARFANLLTASPAVVRVREVATAIEPAADPLADTERADAARARPSSRPMGIVADATSRPESMRSPTAKASQRNTTRASRPRMPPGPNLRLGQSAARREVRAGPADAGLDARIIEALGETGFRLATPGAGFDPTQPATADQAGAIDAILHLAAGRARRPLVLTADRGRGKSAALGIATGRLLRDRGLRILVTAPRRRATDALFRHAEAVRPTRADGSGGLEFIAPDALLEQRPPADLLLVDEAAGIPAPLLEQMLAHYRRIGFATTVHGYEGTGRGFEVRFRRLLDARTPGWRALRLTTPIRWCAGDPLEALIDQALLLDAEPADDASIQGGLGGISYQRPDRDALAHDEDQLRQLFGLLVLGHYQTRPNDLRHLLDGPNLWVATLTADARVLATALVANEGALEPGLHRAIFDGHRRPRGHLLPQTLSAHAGLAEAPGLRFARIVRIAVHPAARRRGLGRRLVGAIAADARRGGADLLGASFGADAALLAFWRRCGLRPLHLGTHRNAASGARAAVVLHALSAAGQALCEHAARRLQHDLPSLLSGPLRTAEPELIGCLLRELDAASARPGPDDPRALEAFAHAHRSLEAALPAIARLTWQSLSGRRADGVAASAAQRALLIRCALQGQDPHQVIAALGLSGRAELIAQLRAAVAAARMPTTDTDPS